MMNHEIVSQNRDLSVEFSQCELWMSSNIIYRRIGTDSKVLGAYATPERARKVFEDIHKAFAPVYSIPNNLSEEQIMALIPSKNVQANDIVGLGAEACITTYDDYVYYMPEK